ASAWLARLAYGGMITMPGRPEQGMLYVDIHDLAGFAVRALERVLLGPYNVTHRATVAEWARACRVVSRSTASLAWASDAPKVPVVERSRAPYRRMGELSAARALAAGLELR